MAWDPPNHHDCLILITYQLQSERQFFIVFVVLISALFKHSCTPWKFVPVSGGLVFNGIAWNSLIFLSRPYEPLLLPFFGPVIVVIEDVTRRKQSRAETGRLANYQFTLKRIL